MLACSTRSSYNKTVFPLFSSFHSLTLALTVTVFQSLTRKLSSSKFQLSLSKTLFRSSWRVITLLTPWKNPQRLVISHIPIPNIDQTLFSVILMVFALCFCNLVNNFHSSARECVSVSYFFSCQNTNTWNSHAIAMSGLA